MADFFHTGGPLTAIPAAGDSLHLSAELRVAREDLVDPDLAWLVDAGLSVERGTVRFPPGARAEIVRYVTSPTRSYLTIVFPDDPMYNAPTNSHGPHMPARVVGRKIKMRIGNDG